MLVFGFSAFWLCEDFDASAVAEAVEQVFTIFPGKAGGSNVGYSET